MKEIPMSLGEMVDEGLVKISLPSLPDLPQHLQPLETKEPHMAQSLISLELALAVMEDAAAAGDYQKAQDAAQLAHESGLMKHGGPSASIFLFAKLGFATTDEIHEAMSLVKDSIDSLQKVER